MSALSTRLRRAEQAADRLPAPLPPAVAYVEPADPWDAMWARYYHHAYMTDAGHAAFEAAYSALAVRELTPAEVAAVERAEAERARLWACLGLDRSFEPGAVEGWIAALYDVIEHGGAVEEVPPVPAFTPLPQRLPSMGFALGNYASSIVFRILKPGAHTAAEEESAAPWRTDDAGAVLIGYPLVVGLWMLEAFAVPIPSA